MQAIVTFIKPGDAGYADIHEFEVMPRVGELINIGDFEREWWRVTEVVHTDRQHPDGPPTALVVEPTEPSAAIRKKSETRDK